MVSEREETLWITLSSLFDDIPAACVVERLLAQGFTHRGEIKQTYFDVVAAGMSMLRLTDRHRHEPFPQDDIIEVCGQFYRPRPSRFAIKQLGRFMCWWAGGVKTRWDALETELTRQLAAGVR